MSKIVLAFLFSASIFLACRKDDPDKFSSINSIDAIGQYDFYYRDFVPDSILPMIYLDRSVYDLDIDKDLTPDIRFDLYSSTTVVTHQSTNVYLIKLIALDSLQFVYEDDGCDFRCSGGLDLSTAIMKDGVGRDYLWLYQQNPMWAWCLCFGQPEYVGIVYQKEGKKYLGWIHLHVDSLLNVQIDDFALNGYECDSILTGQH